MAGEAQQASLPSSALRTAARVPATQGLGQEVLILSSMRRTLAVTVRGQTAARKSHGPLRSCWPLGREFGVPGSHAPLRAFSSPTKWMNQVSNV